MSGTRHPVSGREARKRLEVTAAVVDHNATIQQSHTAALGVQADAISKISIADLQIRERVKAVEDAVGTPCAVCGAVPATVYDITRDVRRCLVCEVIWAQHHFRTAGVWGRLRWLLRGR
jgi:hypothetical protein